MIPKVKKVKGNYFVTVAVPGALVPNEKDACHILQQAQRLLREQMIVEQKAARTAKALEDAAQPQSAARIVVE